MPPKILVVDDNLEMRELMHMYLTEAGYVVRTACDGREGLILARSERPDLIVTDVTMPNLDGIELTRQLRAESGTRHTPIIVWSCVESAAALDAAITAGANRAMRKPVHFESLVEDVVEVLEEASGGSRRGE